MAINTENTMTGSTDTIRDRAIRLFTFLRNLSELRTTTIRSLDNYEKVIWLDTIPHAKDCFCAAWRPDDAVSADLWVEIAKSKLLPPPVPPEELLRWIKPGTLEDSESDSPELRQSIIVEEEGEPDEDGNPTIETSVWHLAEHPEIQSAWDDYFDYSWVPWAQNDRELRRVKKVYDDLFAVYQQYQRLGESYEVLLGMGYLTWRTAAGYSVNRHLVTAHANIVFDPTRGRVSVVPSAEGAKPTLEQDMLEPDDCPEANELRVVEQLIVDMGDAVWRDGDIHTVLKSWVNAYPDSREYSDVLSPHQEIEKHPVVTFAPAIILRKRTERSLVRVFKDICEQMSDKSSLIPHGVRILVDDPDTIRNEGEIPYTADSSLDCDTEIYFPLAANDQQIEIARQVATKQGVLVQGPPGTGKSHTIANLVCHLLATGNRVLVTSQTARALEVLRDKFPQEIAPLCVIALGDDARSMKNLEASVLGITQQQNAWNPEVNKKEIMKLENALDAARKEESRLAYELRAIRESETFVHQNMFGSYCGTLQSIAARIKDETETLGWFPFAPKEDAEPPMTDAEAASLLALLREFDRDAKDNLSLRIVEPSILPTPGEFSLYVSRESEAGTKYEASSKIQERPDYKAVSSCSAELRVKLVDTLRDLRLSIVSLSQDSRPWVKSCIQDVLNGRGQTWMEIQSITRDHLDAIGENARAVAEYTVDGLDGISRRIHKASAEGLLRHLKSGGKLGVGPFRPKLVKDARHLIEKVYVNGRLCNAVEPLVELLQWIDVVDRFEALDNYWNLHITPSPTSFPVRKAEYENHYEALSAALDLLRQLATARENILSVAGLQEPVWAKTESIAALEETVSAVSLEEDLLEAKRAFESLEKLAEECRLDPCMHPVSKQLSRLVVDRDVDGYSRVYDELEGLSLSKRRLDECYRLLELLGTFSKSMGQTLVTSSSDLAWDRRMEHFCAAWNRARADRWLKRMSNPNEQRKLSNGLDAQRQTIQKTLAELASAKAWGHCLSSLNQHQSQHLRSWQLSVKSIGKGTGKHANRHRRNAREHLEQCRTAIPAWIMPIYRVAETIDIKPNIFDVVIVDEASQSGPEALFLQYIAEKIVVVGDDKQISPSFVGVEKQPVDLLRDRLIRDLPHSDRMGIEHSFFDQAFIRYPSHVCLQEHFRCMPEIIQFSNNLCYSSTPLIPLKQYGAGRLSPTVIAAHIPDGYQKGRSPKVTNPPEAEAIAEKIASCCKDPAYTAKTMGVISLLGEEQAKLIQSLLMDRIGAEEMDKRRIHCGDAYAFQGDERDVMFLSMVSAPGNDHRIGTLSDHSAEKRFNVAASRAKEQMWLFHSATLNDLSPQCLRYRLLEYCQDPGIDQTDVCGMKIDQLRAAALSEGRGSIRPPHPFDSWFEVDVFLRIVGRGYRVLPQHKVAGYSIDLLIEGMQGRLAVECDGDEWHGPEQYESDMARQRQLERSGYVFWRVRGSAFYRDPEAALSGLWTMLDQMRVFPKGVDTPVPSGASSGENDTEGKRDTAELCRFPEVEGDEDLIVDSEQSSSVTVIDRIVIVPEPLKEENGGKNPCQLGFELNTSGKPALGVIRVVFRRISGNDVDICAIFPEIPASKNVDECLSYTRKNGFQAIGYSDAMRQSVAATPREYSSVYKDLSEKGYDVVITRRARRTLHERRFSMLKESRAENQRSSSEADRTQLCFGDRQDIATDDMGYVDQCQSDAAFEVSGDDLSSSERKVLVDGRSATVVWEEHHNDGMLWYVYFDGDDDMSKVYSPPAVVTDL